METAGIFTDNIIRTALTTPKVMSRKSDDLAKICDYTIVAIDKGLTKKDKVTFLEKLDSLHNKALYFGFFVSANNTNNLHSSYAIVSGRNFWGHTKHFLKMIFAAPKKRREIKDTQFLEAVTRQELLDMIEDSVDKGLKESQVNDMLRKGMNAYCTILEIHLQKTEDNNYFLEFLYS